jgi:hypothetical protein
VPSARILVLVEDADRLKFLEKLHKAIMEIEAIVGKVMVSVRDLNEGRED